MPATSHTILSEPGDWHIPATQFEWTQNWGDIPFPLMVCLGSLVIGFLTQSLIRRFGTGTGIVALVALSYGFEDRHFLSALLLAALAYLFLRAQRNPQGGRYIGPLLMMILAVAVFTTLEIGIVCLFWLLLFVPYSLTADSKRWFKQSGFLATFSGLVLLVLGGWNFGLWNTLLRPWSAVTSPRYPELFDSIGPVLGLEVPTLAQTFLLLTLALCWFHYVSGSNRVLTNGLCLALFTLLGALCGYYLWLSAVASVLCLHTFPSANPISEIAKPEKLLRFGATLTIGLISALRIGGEGTTFREYLFEGNLATHRIDPTAWAVEGPVLLLDLDRCSEWLDLLTVRQLPPVIDDRWDLYGEHYSEYAALVRDLREMRALIYFRTDQEFGGYLHQIQDWKPVLVVAETQQHDAIRDLSMSPHWKMMGTDGESSFFGRENIPANRQPILAAGRTLLSLEWPGRDASPPNPQVIAASRPLDASRVAGVLNAIRLPYAALRILPETHTLEDQKIMAWSYLELSYRVHRNTGHHSLLDEFRALHFIRKLAAQNRWTHREAERLRSSLRGLDLEHVADRIFQVTDSNNHRDSDDFRSLTPDSLSLEELVRQHLRAGKIESAQPLIEQLPPSIQEFYSAILSSPSLSLAELAKSMYRLIEQEELPRETQSELLFYLGCVAIEAGDYPVAVEALSQSEQMSPQSQLTPIRATYLHQLQSQ